MAENIQQEVTCVNAEFMSRIAKGSVVRAIALPSHVQIYHPSAIIPPKVKKILPIN